MNNLIKITLVLGILSLISCQEEYDLPNSETPVQLVVDGRITNEYVRHGIRLSLAGDYQQSSYTPASGATVQISDGEQLFLLEEDQPGLYLTDSLAGVPGQVYRLSIYWDGELYTAQDTMGQVPEFFEMVPFRKDELGFWEFEYRRHQFGFRKPGQWELIVAPVDTSDLPNISVDLLGQQIGVEVTEQGVYHFEFFTHPNISVNGLLNFEEAHFYGFRSNRIVRQRHYSLSDQYYEFLNALFLETEWRGTLFDTTPASVKGNINNGALGFFCAQAMRERSLILE